jgi:hypothetical protein
VIAALRARGLWAAPGRRLVQHAAPTSPLETARAEAVARERHADARRAPYRQAWAASDAYRESMRQVAATRALATAAGPDAPGVWEALALAAQAETEAEADLAESTEERP